MRFATVATGWVLTAFAASAFGQSALPPGANEMCPVMTKKKAKATRYVDYEGHRIYVCCNTCIKRMTKDPKKYLSNLPPLASLPPVPAGASAAPGIPEGKKAGGVSGAPPLRAEKVGDAVVVTQGENGELLRYVLKKPAGSPLSVDSACYLHPLVTPSGLPVTDVAPDDHRHHRGVFLAWVEMHGRKDADFWGWGEHAPKDGRSIVNREVSDLKGGPDGASFRATNDWKADGDALVTEELEVHAHVEDAANVVELTYTLTADADVTLARWAFSGFCLRARKDGTAEPVGPDGVVKLPAPKHTDPATDWPAAPWYGLTLKLPDGKIVGAAVIDHPKNPPSLWHNPAQIRMINPCIVAPGPVTLKAKQPLVLRYCVVAQDGPLDGAEMGARAEEFRKP